MANAKADFVHLHLHTEYSLLDSTIRLTDLFEKAKKYKMAAIAMTDHGNLSGAIQFYQQAQKTGIKPIIGCEICVAPRSRFDKQKSTIVESTRPLILLAKNIQGYKNLLKLVSAAHIEGFCGHPRVDKDLLRQYSEGLIASSACLYGEIASNIVRGNMDEARIVACEYRKIFGEDNFYLEIMKHGISDQKIANQGLIELSEELSIPLVATNDCHYLNAEHAEAYNVLVCIQKGETIECNDCIPITSDQFYVKSPAEMQSLFATMPESIANTVSIADRCNLELEFNKFYLPNFVLKNTEETSECYLERKAVEGLEKLLPTIMKYQNEGAAVVREKYNKRMHTELEIIKKLGFSGYFLIVSDYVNYAKRHDIPVGPGRGSVAGSLLAYALRITDIDPIRYNLYFEGFLNLNNISMPHIDIDFCQEGVEKLIKYVTTKYGRNKVSKIVMFEKMTAKAVIHDVGRVMNIPYGVVDKIVKLVPNVFNISLADTLKMEPRFAEECKMNPQIDKLLSLSLILEGLNRHSSIHETCAVISETPLVETVPLFAQNDDIVSQFTMRDIEAVGLTMFNFLGLKALTVIKNTLNLIKKSKGIEIDIYNLPLDDAETYDLLMKGDTDGVFQFENPGIKALLIKFKPDHFEDLMALIAVYRPDPMKIITEFVNRKNGKIKITYELPQLEPILKETYGIILYQEQVMQIANVIGGYTMAEANTLRKLLSKGRSVEIEKGKLKFLARAKEQLINENQAKAVWNKMETFAKYGFNKSHSTSYSMISYQTAYLKTHYPVDFEEALISNRK